MFFVKKTFLLSANIRYKNRQILSKTENEKKLCKVFRVILKTKNRKIVLPPSHVIFYMEVKDAGKSKKNYMEILVKSCNFHVIFM